MTRLRVSNTRIATAVLPLSNIRILITRARHQASSLATQLQAAGAETILIPTIELGPPTDLKPLRVSLEQIAAFDWIIFTSANAVEAFSKHYNRASRLPQIAAIGPATAKALAAIGATPDLIPPTYVAESLAEAMLPHLAITPPRPVRVLIVRAEQARDILPETLIAAGADVTIVPAYRTITPPGSIESLRALFDHPAHYPNAITFTSSSTATNLFHLLDSARIVLPPNVTLASIGSITSQTLRDLQHPPHLEAAEATIPSLVDALINLHRQ